MKDILEGIAGLLLIVLAFIGFILLALLINGFIALLILWIGSLIFGYQVTFGLVLFCAVVMTLLRR